MKKFVVLGGYGNIGKVIVKDLFESCKNGIIIAGNDLKKAKHYANSFHNKRVKYAKVDVTNIKETSRLLKNADVCINSTQYYYNLHVMKACLISKTNYLDLGGLFHMTRKQLKLNNKFKKINKAAILGCGSTPGITNILASYGYKKLKHVSEIHISFGDYDKTRYNPPFILPYSMNTLLDEFTLKPPVLTKGKLKFFRPGYGEHYIEFPKPAGKIKGFYSIHSELATFPKSFKLKECTFTLTFPEEFIKEIKSLINKGVKNKREIKIMNQWPPNPKTKINDLEYVRVELIGNKKIILDCLTKSRFNIPAGTYDTAVPASIIAQFISKNKINFKGASAPEFIVPELEFFKELKKRNIFIYLNNKRVI